jgi:predicted nucleic-acid-binding protein
MVEVAWVPHGVYGAPRASIATAIETMLTTANVEVEDAAAFARAVDWFRRGLDFADALHLASSRHTDAFVTFDAAMRRRPAAMSTTPPIVVP